MFSINTSFLRPLILYITQHGFLGVSLTLMYEGFDFAFLLHLANTRVIPLEPLELLEVRKKKTYQANRLICAATTPSR